MRLVVLLTGPLAMLVVCGGRLDMRQPPGYVDDNGVFRTPDGKPLFEPGAKCAGYGWRSIRTRDIFFLHGATTA